MVLKCNEINRGAKGNGKLYWLRPHWCLTGDSLSHSLLEEKQSQDYAWHTSPGQFSPPWLSSYWSSFRVMLWSLFFLDPSIALGPLDFS